MTGSLERRRDDPVLRVISTKDGRVRWGASGYVRKPGTVDQHQCDLPAEWIVGAVWRCTKGHLWVVRPFVQPYTNAYVAGDPSWEPAGWWMRRRHGGTKARLGMANGNWTLTAKHLAPPPNASPFPPPPPPDNPTRLRDYGGRIDPMPDPYNPGGRTA